MLTLDIDNKTETKFNKLLRNSGMNFSILVNSMLNYRINEIKKGMRNLEFDFINYENKYKIKTKTFYQKYMKGDFGDESENNDFMIWSGEYEAYTEFKSEIKQLL